METNGKEAWKSVWCVRVWAIHRRPSKFHPFGSVDPARELRLCTQFVEKSATICLHNGRIAVEVRCENPFRVERPLDDKPQPTNIN